MTKVSFTHIFNLMPTALIRILKWGVSESKSPVDNPLSRNCPPDCVRFEAEDPRCKPEDCALIPTHPQENRIWFGVFFIYYSVL